MAALVCDLCGGKLVMGSGGIAVCDSCGMEHSADRMKEKVQEIKGTVRVDNSHMIENYLEMANNAFNAENNAEAESYCNKIIEIEPTNYKAWFLKGKAAGWQSTLQNSRIPESVAAFAKAITNAPEEEKEELIEQSKAQVINLSKAMISLRGQRFSKWPDEDEANGFTSDITAILNVLVQFITQAGVAISLSELMAPIATIINQSVVKAYQDVIFPDYDGDPNDKDDRANKYEWQRYIERIGHCTSLLEKAIGLCDEDDEDDIQRYENLIHLHKQAISSCSWDYKMVETFTGWERSWYKEWQLTEEAKNLRRNLIREYESKVAKIHLEIERKEKEEAKKRNDEYWAEHADEKVALEAEKETLEEQISALLTEIENIPEKAEADAIQKRMNELTVQLQSLGLFKGKEKKAIQEKIDTENAKWIETITRRDTAENEIKEKKLLPLQQRLNEIKIELSRNH